MRQVYISKTLKTKSLIRPNKKKKIPLRTFGQIRSARTKCGWLYRISANKSLILDDKSYFTFNYSSINGNDVYYSTDVSQTLASVKFKPTVKFEKKLLAWICFGDKGISSPIFRESGFAISLEVYKNNCIKNKLIPFIKKHHSDGEYIFWPDLASSHYAKSVQNYMNEKKINFVKREEDPTNVHECRPFEDFWSVLKGKVYDNNWQAKNLKWTNLLYSAFLSQFGAD